MDYLPRHKFRKCVKRYRGNYKVKSFSCWASFWVWLLLNWLIERVFEISRRVSGQSKMNCSIWGFVEEHLETWKGISKHSGSCEWGSWLADLYWFCSSAHQSCKRIICWWGFCPNISRWPSRPFFFSSQGCLYWCDQCLSPSKVWQFVFAVWRQFWPSVHLYFDLDFWLC